MLGITALEFPTPYASDADDSIDKGLAVREQWLGACLGRGGPVKVVIGDKTIEGVFDTIDPHGRLIVLTADGTTSIDAGDVLLGPAARASLRDGKA